MTSLRALPLLAASYFFAFGSGGIQLPLTAPAMQRVGLSMSAIGLMWAARSVLGTFGPTVWGVLADRRGDARPFAFASLFSGAVIIALLGQTTSPVWAVVLFGLYGFMCGPSGSILDGMVLTALGGARERFGRWRMWGTIGFGVFSVGAAVLIDRGLLEPVPSVLFSVCALLTLLSAVMILFIPKMPRPALARVRDVLPILRRPDMIALFATSLTLWCSHVAYTSFITPLALSRGIPAWAVGGSIGAAIVVEAIMLRASGFFLRRFGGRPVMIAVCAVTVVRWLLTAVITDPVLFVLVNAMHGVTFGLFFGTLVALIAERAPPQMRQAAQGTIGSAAFGVGGACGSLLVGNIFETAGPQGTWLVMAGIAAASLGIAWRWVR